MLRKASRFLVALTLIVVACGLTLGCGSSAPQESPGARPQGSTSQADASRAVVINGRSVARGWMDHWGYSGEGSVQKNGYALEYKELNGDEIASSFAQNVDGLQPGSVVFFKFCFVDFDGSNLAERERQLDQVVATAREKGLKLIVGNALPVRKQDGSPQIVAEEKAFNSYLDQKAAGEANVWVLDMNSVLANADGFLKTEYETEDSHPNDSAYSALDQVFFPLLANAFAGTHP